MRRSRVLTSLIAVASLASAGVFIVGAPSASADTITPDYAYEGWFARNKAPAPQVEVPCTPTTVRPSCGPTSVTTVPAPQAPDTGAYVVSSSGGATGDKSDLSGDTAWTAFSWDIFGQLGATVDKFVVTLTQTPQTNDPSTSRRNDTYNGSGTPPPIQACNIVVPWSAAPGANAWEDRPQSDTNCVAPTVAGTKFTFDLSAMAQTWVEGTGYGMLILPGQPGNPGATTTSGTDDDTVPPFQITFSGYETTLPSPTREQVLPKVTFEFTPAPEDDFNTDFGGGGGGEEFFEEIITSDGGGFEAMPDLDVIPTDIGSEPLPEAMDSSDVTDHSETAAGPLTRRTRPISRDVGFPWIALLLLPLIAIAFWGTGTALGPIGDPVPVREGGVTRVLANRHGSTHLDTR
ncbi:MAG: hypothetical protein KY443_06880 [Actinobacteria bacterium]|nr:hypothetical protein [Actinomycetota bacterium]